MSGRYFLLIATAVVLFGTMAAYADVRGSRPIRNVEQIFVPPSPDELPTSGWQPMSAPSGVVQTAYEVPGPPPEPAIDGLNGGTIQGQTVDAVFHQVSPAAYFEACDATMSCDCNGCVPCDGCCGIAVDSCDGCCASGCLLSQPLGERWTLMNLFPGCMNCAGEISHPFEIGGWWSVGYHSKSNGLFNNRPHSINTHQAWLYFEKEADQWKGLDWGFRTDIVYGQDAADTQAFGNNPGGFDFQNGWDRGAGYGWAMPQLYAEVAANDVSIRVGHFFTLLGYEVVPAPDNFFYSHSYTMVNSEAFTHTGVLGTITVSDNLTVYAGYTLGWDTGFDQYNQNGENGSSFLGGYAFNLSEDVSITHIITAGDLGLNGDGWSQSIVADLALTDKLNYVFQTDLFDAEDSETFGINQYLIYSMSERLGVGFRGEWWKSNGVSVGALTAGLNVRQCANFTLRPEVRYQWDPGTYGGTIEQASDGSAIFGIDAIMTF